MKGPWSFLRPPGPRDVAPVRRSKGLSRPPAPYDALVVIDFEWTADNRRRIEPIAEIIQFPAVLVRFTGPSFAPATVVAAADGGEFDTFVKPIYNPKLTQFSKDLCGITQAEVDAAPELGQALCEFLAWLQRHGLVDASTGRKATGPGSLKWCFCTWSDADIGGTLSAELRHKDIALPPCFSDWIDLKTVFRRLYSASKTSGGRPDAPSGGLRRCVEFVGLAFEGRAHNGLVDARNTARLAAAMVRDGAKYTTIITAVIAINVFMNSVFADILRLY
eukprot:g3845.t1